MKRESSNLNGFISANKYVIVLLMIGIILLLYNLVVGDLRFTIFTLGYVLLALFILLMSRDTTKETHGMAYAALLNDQLRKSHDPPNLLRETIGRFLKNEKPPREVVIKILRQFSNYSDEVGIEAQRLLSEVTSTNHQ
jgi:hypothetical protein